MIQAENGFSSKKEKRKIWAWSELFSFTRWTLSKPALQCKQPKLMWHSFVLTHVTDHVNQHFNVLRSGIRIVISDWFFFFADCWFFYNDVKSTKRERFSATRHSPKGSFEWMPCCKNQWTWPWSWQTPAKADDRAFPLRQSAPRKSHPVLLIKTIKTTTVCWYQVMNLTVFCDFGNSFESRQGNV